MLTEPQENVLNYAICMLSSALIFRAWWLWRRQREVVRTPMCRRMTVVSLVLASLSSINLAVFPTALHYVEATRSELADTAYIRSVQVGFFAASASTLLALFAAGRLRASLVFAALLLFGAWLLIGSQYK